jgi:signal transduction histidine kinase
MSLVAIKPDPQISIRTFIRKRHAVLSGDTMEHKAIMHFDLMDAETVRRFEHPELVSRLNLKKMSSIPIFNPWNFNHLRLIVNLFPQDEKSLLNDDEMFRFGEYVAFTLDSALEDLCSAEATKVNFEAGRCKGVRDFLDSLVELMRTTINCDGVAIFLVNDLGSKLKLEATTGTKWTVLENEQFYREGEGLTGWVWQTRQTLVTANASTEERCKRKSFEGIESRADDACLFVPLVKPTGEVIGVIRCRTKSAARILGKSQVSLFLDDDAAILEAIAQAAIPHLELLLVQERRVKAVGRLTHELKVPLVAIRGAAEFMMRVPRINEFFDYDYPGDIWSWTELMGRLIDNADALRYSAEGMQIRPSLARTYLLRDVIAPAIRQARLLLKDRGFSSQNIKYNKESFMSIPRLWLDRNQFQQVAFNLLSNAIKYAYDDPDAFRVEIAASEDVKEFVIWFRDWGPGIESDMEEVIFEEGFRGQHAVENNVAGQGLGLWVARQIIEGHGGTIEATSPRWPTEFTISLPRRLASRQPF